nr:MAG TPA: Complement C1q-like protein [Caudoviricetes sp.]
MYFSFYHLFTFVFIAYIISLKGGDYIWVKLNL